MQTLYQTSVQPGGCHQKTTWCQELLTYLDEALRWRSECLDPHTKRWMASRVFPCQLRMANLKSASISTSEHIKNSQNLQTLLIFFRTPTSHRTCVSTESPACSITSKEGASKEGFSPRIALPLSYPRIIEWGYLVAAWWKRSGTKSWFKRSCAVNIVQIKHITRKYKTNIKYKCIAQTSTESHCHCRAKDFAPFNVMGST